MHLDNMEQIQKRVLEDMDLSEENALLRLSIARVCLKRNNPQTQVDFASVQGRNPKA